MEERREERWLTPWNGLEQRRRVRDLEQKDP